MTLRPLIIIPARMQATRLPGKPLADIGGKPMIVHVAERAAEARVGEVIVAAGEKEIADAVSAHGGKAVLTPPDLPSGSDRIWHALESLEGESFDTVINLQGDLPLIDPQVIRDVLSPLAQNPHVDIATPVCPMAAEDYSNPNAVKAVVEFAAPAPRPGDSGRALYFTRAAAPWGEGGLWHHIGIYAYRRAALKEFIKNPQGMLEKREKLEQLRALALGLRIEAVVAASAPLSVDTPEDLEHAREAYKEWQKKLTIF